VLRVIDSMQLTAKYKVAMPVIWEAGRRCHHCGFGVGRRREEDLVDFHKLTPSGSDLLRLIDGLRSRPQPGATWLRRGFGIVERVPRASSSLIRWKIRNCEF
jgi:hypothetical protein